jgi:uncharacterized protein YbjT (DUF2867 family)
MIRNALIAGATGLTGHDLVKLLLKSEYYNSLHIIGRRPYELEHPKIRSYVVDFENFHDFKTEGIIHDVYICLGTTIKKAGSKQAFRKVDLEYVRNIGEWAVSHKVEKIAVISSMGANASSANFYLRTKGEMELCLTDMNFSHIIILRPSLLLGKRHEFRFAEHLSSLLMKPFMGLMRGRLIKYKPVETRIVAEAMFKSTVQADERFIILKNTDIHRFRQDIN